MPRASWYFPASVTSEMNLAVSPRFMLPSAFPTYEKIIWRSIKDKPGINY